MQEIFYEESSRCHNASSENKKYNLFKTFASFSFIVAIFWFFMGFYLFPVDNFVVVVITTVLPVAIFVVIGVVFSKLKNNFSVDYDYTFVSGSIRISKVIKNVKRFPVVSFETFDIEKIGKIESKTFEYYVNQVNSGINFINASSNKVSEEGKDFYYIVFNFASQKNLIRLECSKTFIMNVLKFCNRTVIDGELLK